jgi:hypothetical protein
MQAADSVDGDAPWVPAASRGHVNRPARHLPKIEMRSRIGVAEYRSGPARENATHPAAEVTLRPVPDDEDTLMLAMQPAVLDPTVDTARAHPEADQLLMRHPPVLSTGELGNDLLTCAV